MVIVLPLRSVDAKLDLARHCFVLFGALTQADRLATPVDLPFRLIPFFPRALSPI